MAFAPNAIFWHIFVNNVTIKNIKNYLRKILFYFGTKNVEELNPRSDFPVKSYICEYGQVEHMTQKGLGLTHKYWAKLKRLARPEKAYMSYPQICGLS
jgi:hypothetical protein